MCKEFRSLIKSHIRRKSRSNKNEKPTSQGGRIFPRGEFVSRVCINELALIATVLYGSSLVIFSNSGGSGSCFRIAF